MAEVPEKLTGYLAKQEKDVENFDETFFSSSLMSSYGNLTENIYQYSILIIPSLTMNTTDPSVTLLTATCNV